MENKKHRYRLYSESDTLKILYVDGFRTSTIITRCTCNVDGKFWIEWRVYSRDAIGAYRVGTGYTLPKARKIAIDHYEKERTI